MSSKSYYNFEAFRDFVKKQGYRFNKKPNVQERSHQYRVTDGEYSIFVTFYNNGNILVQGPDTDCKRSIDHWAASHRVEPNKQKAPLYSGPPYPHISPPVTIVKEWASLTDDMVHYIRKQFDDGVSYAELAAKYRVTEEVIREVILAGDAKW